MDRQKVIDHIYKLAKTLNKKNRKMSRGDIAYNLERFGLDKDSIEISNLVWECWRQNGEDEIVKKVFVNNDGIGSIVEECQLHDLVEKNEVSVVFDYVKGVLKGTKTTLNELDYEIKRSLSDKCSIEESSGTLSKIASKVTGTSGVNRIKSEANIIFSNITNVKECYELACDDVRSVIMTFVELREGVMEIFRKYSLLLTDLYGDSIKVVSPELFDFNSVEWLNTDDLYTAIELEYNKLSSTCTALIGEISESFSASLNQSATAFRTGGESVTGLLLASLTMLGHYTESSEKTLKLQQDLLRFKKNARKDITTIKADMFRLNTIFRTLNELLIPKADAFYKYSNGVLKSRVEHISALLYSKESMKNIVSERDDLLEQLKSIEREMSDHEVTIAYYKKAIHDSLGILDAGRHTYEESKSNKPSKPNVFINILSLGTLGKSYNRNIYEWKAKYGHIIDAHEAVIVDVELFRKEINEHQKAYDDNKKLCESLKRTLRKKSKQVSELAVRDNDVKIKMLSHLKDIIGLMKVAKEILSSRLEERLIKKVDVQNVNFDVTEDEIKEIEKFTQSFKDSAIISSDDAVSAIVADETIEEQELLKINELEQNLVQKASDFIREWEITRKMASADRKEESHYNKELMKIKQSFDDEMKKIDSKGEVLRRVLAKINLSNDDDDLTDALLMLAEGNDVSFSEKDIEQMLLGNKEIII